jgi:hypothetical protein
MPLDESRVGSAREVRSVAGSPEAAPQWYETTVGRHHTAACSQKSSQRPRLWRQCSEAATMRGSAGKLPEHYSTHPDRSQAFGRSARSSEHGTPPPATARAGSQSGVGTGVEGTESTGQEQARIVIRAGREGRGEAFQGNRGSARRHPLYNDALAEQRHAWNASPLLWTHHSRKLLARIHAAGRCHRCSGCPPTPALRPLSRETM